MRLLLMPAVLFLVSQNGNEAQKLFEKMSKKLADAKELHINAEATFESGKKEGKLRATIRLAKGNKNNTSITADFGGKEITMAVISNGSKMKLRSPFDKETETKDTPEDFNAKILRSLQQGGAFMSTMALPSSGKKKEPFKISDFTLGKKDKVGEHDAQTVKYKLKMPQEDELIDVELWIDAATHVPLKRILTGKSKSGEMARIAETYRVLLNPKAQPELFKLAD